MYRYAAAGEVYDVLDCVRPLLRGGESARPLRQHLPPVLHGGGWRRHIITDTDTASQ